MDRFDSGAGTLLAAAVTAAIASGTFGGAKGYTKLASSIADTPYHFKYAGRFSSANRSRAVCLRLCATSLALPDADRWQRQSLHPREPATSHRRQ